MLEVIDRESARRPLVDAVLAEVRRLHGATRDLKGYLGLKELDPLNSAWECLEIFDRETKARCSSPTR